VSPVEITIAISINGVAVPVVLDDVALHSIAAALAPSEEPSPYLSIEEAAAFLRTGRQRIYDLCSSGCLERVKEGRRTLLRRADLEAWLQKEGRHMS
jgi:excisionase family DNA binding protein